MIYMVEEKRLRIGIACDGRLAAWQKQTIGHLLERGAEVAAVITVPEPQVRRGLAWRIFEAFFRPPSARISDVRAIAGDVETLRWSDAEAIGARDLDCILNFGGEPKSNDVLPPARYGVWTFAFGAPHLGGGPPCFWEILEGDPVVSAALLRYDAGETTVLREGHFKIVDYRFVRSVDRLYCEAAKWPAYAAAQIAAGVVARRSAPRSATAAPARMPSLGDVAAFAFTVAKNAIRRLIEREYCEQWNIGIARAQPAQVVDGAPLGGVRWLGAIDGGWVADPMARRSNGLVHVLCEEMRLESGKGRISATSFDGTSWRELGAVIEPKTHASYPYLFEHRASIYCVPETFEANEIALYRAREFPQRWERVATLMDGIAAIDGTLFEHDGLIWIFCTTSQDSNGTLMAFFARDILGPWQPHAGNPIKIDVRGSRPAGAPFRIGERLYRPAQ